MKIIISFTLLIVFSISSFCQSTPNDLPTVKTDYLKKSKNQKIAAWVLLGGGIILETTTWIIAIQDVEYGSDVSRTTLLVMGFTGGAAILGSIPLFIASGKNKKKAMNMSANIKMEKVTINERQSFVQSSYPAIAFKINL
jgi:hypothetical protein